MATTQELIALFGDDFNDVLKGLSALPPEAREILDQAMGKMLFDADVFSSRVRKAVQTQTAAGISMEAIKAGLLTDMNTGGAVFGEIRNAIKGSLVEGINQSGRAGQFQALDPDENTLFTWVTVAGHKICQDCAPRGGLRKTLKEWESEGLPGTGWSVCKGHCYCILDASGKISPRVERETGLLSEKGATARPKKPTATAIKWKASMTTEEAVAWSKNSKVKGVTYHGTTQAGAKGIRENGFDLTKGRTGKLYGNGAYVTKSEKEVASIFAQDGVVIKTMVKAEKPFTVFGDDFQQMIMGAVPTNMDGTVYKGFEKYWTSAKKRVYGRYFSKHGKDFAENVYKMPNRPPATLDNKWKQRFSMMMEDDYDDWIKKMSAKDRAGFEEMMETSNKWYEWLDKQYVAGNKDVIAWLDDAAMITPNSDMFPDTFRQFLLDEGYDSLIVEKVFSTAHPELLDDYFIMLSKENIVAITD